MAGFLTFIRAGNGRGRSPPAIGRRAEKYFRVFAALEGPSNNTSPATLEGFLKYGWGVAQGPQIRDEKGPVGTHSKLEGRKVEPRVTRTALDAANSLRSGRPAALLRNIA